MGDPVLAVAQIFTAAIAVAACSLTTTTSGDSLQRVPRPTASRLPASRRRYPTPRSPPPPPPLARRSSMKPDATKPPCRRHRTVPCSVMLGTEVSATAVAASQALVDEARCHEATLQTPPDRPLLHHARR
ncbi:unnamed protein product [Miscanthus lutarioriparius]|uniref:Secreted protein n=1 Tax=Miscanthus lutarioriparius TaxID=422564 RepID=A0A811QS60_9POAL|nr:unnamed protein product [Miscanthus lutarioriparius]